MSASPFRKVDSLMRVEPAGPVSARVSVPGSKSLTNRFLLLAAMAEGDTRLRGPLHSDDTRYMRQVLKQLGVVVVEEDDAWIVSGKNHWQHPDDELFVGNAGTVMRFLTPALSARQVKAVITGNERMLVRPIGDLVDGLHGLGASVAYVGEAGYPPLSLQQGMQSGTVTIKGDASSQYLSGLLMALPQTSGSSTVEIDGHLVSHTYVEMTVNCMAQLGVQVEIDASYRKFQVSSAAYRASDINIEPDASTASYWFALSLMVGGSVWVDRVPDQSYQGDFGLLDIIQKMGASVIREDGGVKVTSADLQGVDVDMNTMSDVAPTLAVIATLAQSPTTIRNVANMRIKECDRIDTLQRAFDALGLKMETGPDWMKVYPGKPDREAVLNPEDDHRMAMVFALLGLAHGQVHIQDPECVAKTYPAFYEEMAAVL